MSLEVTLDAPTPVFLAERRIVHISKVCEGQLKANVEAERQASRAQRESWNEGGIQIPFSTNALDEDQRFRSYLPMYFAVASTCPRILASTSLRLAPPGSPSVEQSRAESVK
jgi:hypothetical protein